MSLVITHDEMADWIELIHTSGITSMSYVVSPPAIRVIYLSEHRRKTMSTLRLLQRKIYLLGDTTRRVLFFQALGAYEHAADVKRTESEDLWQEILGDRRVAMDFSDAASMVTVDQLEGGEFCLH